MREYGQIQSAFWTSDLRECSDGAKLLAAYLLTGPHTNGVGCFLLPDGYILEDHPTWKKGELSERFDELSRNGFAYRFERVCYIPKFLMWNTIANGNIARARFLDWVAVPRGLSRQCAAVSMLALSGQWRDADKQVLLDEKSLISDDLYNGLPNGSLNGLRNGLANLFLKFKNQHPTPPHPITEGETNVSLVQKAREAEQAAPKRFNDFWHAYPVKKGKADALKTWNRLKLDKIADTIIADVEARKVQDRQWLDGYAPHGSTYVNARGWEDDIEQRQRVNGNHQPSKQRAGVESLMRGVSNHELDRSGNTSRAQQDGLLESLPHPSNGPSRRDG
jgi:hypothetical protein